MTPAEKETKQYKEKEARRAQMIRNRLWAIASLIVCSQPGELKEFEARLDKGPETSTADTGMIRISQKVREMWPTINVVHDKLTVEAARDLDENYDEEDPVDSKQLTNS